MGLFDRWKRDDRPFWEVPPLPTTDVIALRHHGNACLAREQWKGAICAGWAVWRLAGLHQHQADNLLQGGHEAWRKQDPFDPDREQFLWAVFQRLESWAAPYIDPYAAPREVVNRAATPYAVRAWAVSELRELAGDDAARDFLLRIYFTLARTPRDYMPIRSELDAYALAEALGLPPPWSSA